MNVIQPPPVSTSDHVFKEFGEEGLVFNKSSKKTIYLNPSATVIWKLCDGQRSLEDIAELLRGAYPELNDDFSADVRNAVEAMVGEGALAWAEPA
jgi:hypothetical protein